ncbi:MAG: DUF1365 domain-containing protein [Solirubrobacteraceae bacterium]
MTVSALYEGTVRHRRFAVRDNEFRHKVAYAYLDLAELPGLLGGRLVRPGPGLVRFRRSDYYGDAAVPLADAVRAHAGTSGPVRMLTTLRTLGVCFNPVTFYYCFAAAGEALEAVVADVTNTPWGERHAYIAGDDLEKRLHVSPLMGMDQRYAFRAPAPGETLSVHIESTECGDRAFDATLSLRRRPLALRPLLRGTALRTLPLIYGHALALRLRGVRSHPHPEASRT